MSIKVQNAPDSAVVGWHTTAEGGQGYWNGSAWTVRLPASSTLPASEHDTASHRVKEAVRAHTGTGATVLPPTTQRADGAGREGSRRTRLFRRRSGVVST